jgi:hypothetical protein|tara:strand:+ start:373 stop:666 length:294 start_codon:yes stop_codon:yes gene_type:complete
MGDLLKFPTKLTPAKVQAEMHRNRIDELEVENQYINDDIIYLQNALQKNRDELADILKKLAIMNGEAMVHTFVEFENEWGDDFEFTPDFNLDNPEED